MKNLLYRITKAIAMSEKKPITPVLYGKHIRLFNFHLAVEYVPTLTAVYFVLDVPMGRECWRTYIKKIEE